MKINKKTILPYGIRRPFLWGLPREIPKDSEAYLTGVAPEDGTGV